MSPAPKALAPDLVAGLKRLKLAKVRAVAPEVLQVAKTQRWAPEELLRTLVEAEVAARDESNARARLRSAGFPVVKTTEEFKVAASSVPQATFDYLASLEWIRAAENLCLVGPAGTGKTTCSSPWDMRPWPRACGCATSSPPTWSRSSTGGLADNSVAKIIDSLLRADLVIVDELGFAPLDLHHAVVVVTEGESFRMERPRREGVVGRRRPPEGEIGRAPYPRPLFSVALSGSERPVLGPTPGGDFRWPPVGTTRWPLTRSGAPVRVLSAATSIAPTGRPSPPRRT